MDFHYLWIDAYNKGFTIAIFFLCLGNISLLLSFSHKYEKILNALGWAFCVSAVLIFIFAFVF